MRVLYVQLDATINPAQVDLLEHSLGSCAGLDCDMLLLRLDTPGGLGDSMRSMVKLMLNAQVPVAVWVGPSGARAASAGMFLVAASSVAGMSPQSTIGAASPVSLGGEDVNGTMADKIKNDILSLVRGMAAARERNVDWYVQAVEESVSITAAEALELGVVEFVADSPDDFLRQAGAAGIPWQDEKLFFSAEQIHIQDYQPRFWYSLLSWLLNPQIAYFLLLGGIAGLFFELTNPGAIFPGVFGAICLLLALYSLAVLPTNATGLLLILLGLVLFGLEVKITSYALLSIAGAVCLFMGSLLLFRFEYGFAALPLTTVVATVGTVVLFVLIALGLVTKAQLIKPRSGREAMIGLVGQVLEWENSRGRVRVHGEIWNARSRDDATLKPGDIVRIRDIQGLVLIVERAPDTTLYTED
ncbi:MAG: NfeD family protein [Desulfohalobiaceae bacterium]